MEQSASHEQAKDIAELKKQHGVLEERMNTSYERLRADMADWKTDMQADMAKRDADTAKRDKDNLRWTVGFGIAQIAITITVLGAGFAFLSLVGIPTR